jgi:oxygen-dependent protoporphyrinogen oxidase
MRMAAEVIIPRRSADSDESIGDFMARRFGTEARTYLAEPLLAGIHAGDVDRLSTRALFPRFVEAEQRHGSLLLAFRRERSRRAAREDGAFRSLPDGLSELVGALVAVLPAGRVELGKAATGVVQSVDRGWVVQTAGGDAIAARSLVLTTPAWATAQLVGSVNRRLAELCAGIPYASTATVALAFERGAVQHPLNGSGFVVPKAEGSHILAASWLSSKWQHRAPSGKALMRVFAGGARDPHALDRSDAELVALSLESLRPLLGITGAPLFTRVYRWLRASAQHEVGHLDRMAHIDTELAQHPGLFITGSGFRGVGIPDCVADGRATGKQVAEWLETHVS